MARKTSTAWLTRDPLIALSLANLTVIKIVGRLYGGSYNRYFRPRSIEPHVYAATLILALAAAGIWYALLRHIRNGSSTNRLCAIRVFLLTLAIPAAGVRAVASNEINQVVLVQNQGWTHSVIPAVVLAFWCVLAIVSVFMVWRHPEALFRLVMRSGILLVPFLVITTATLGYSSVQETEVPDAQFGPARDNRSKSPRHTVVLLFDELDYHLAIDNPGHVPMPEMQRLLDASISLDDARSPTDDTLRAIPSITVGRVVSSAEPVSDADLFLRFADGQSGLWSKQNHLFARARAAGDRVGVLGWYHPYCRVFGRAAASCQWWPFFQYAVIDQPTLGSAIYVEARSLLESASYSPFGHSMEAEQHSSVFRQMLPAARNAVADPKLDLVWIHFSIPHAPFFFNSAGGSSDYRVSGLAGYSEALRLVDATIGQLRAAMESAGLWESTNVIVMADHSLRATGNPGFKRDWRVPFMIKVAFSHLRLSWKGRFSTIATADLVMTLLQGEQPSGVTDWLQQKAISRSE